MKRYPLSDQFGLALASCGIDPQEVLRRAGLPADTLSTGCATVTDEQYCRLVEAAGHLAPTDDTAVRLTTYEGIERFSPPIFAAFCSRDGLACLERLAQHKRLIGPIRFAITSTPESVALEIVGAGAPTPLPRFCVECEFAFVVGLLRAATKEKIAPVRARMRGAGEHAALAEFLGCPVEAGGTNTLEFRAQDLAIPFVSRSDAMLEVIAPELRRRLEELDADETTAARLRAVLVEMLPAGECTADEAARRLGTSKRSLQRALTAEGTSFAKQLARTRELLARRYLSTTRMPTEEISYLLGYVEHNSFLRAFSTWTGTTPAKYRASRPA